MDFIQLLRQSITADRMVNTYFDSDILIPNIYDYPAEEILSSLTAGNYLHLLAGGTNCIELPFSFTCAPLDCILLLYTEQGGGRLSGQGQKISMTEGSFLLYDCKNAFSLQTLVLPWVFKIFFVSGRDRDLFTPFLPLASAGNITGVSHPALIMDLTRLLSVPTRVDTAGLLQMHQALTNIFHSFCTSALTAKKAPPKNIPYYLAEMKDAIDHHYTRAFSLAFYEELLKINKYRLCREFSSTFGDSPLRYLNKKRIEKAKEMLLTTDLNIQEISSKVGYDNVNHFINLFKKAVGNTPKAFRQKAPALPPVGRSPAQ